MDRDDFEHWLETNLEDVIDSLSSDERTADRWIRDLTTKLRALVAEPDEDDEEIDPDFEDEEPVEDEEEEEEASF